MTMPHAPEAPPRGRLAPSPTGGLHLGHARTFLVAWLAARSGGGSVTLRIEDLDRGRARPEVIPGIVEDLRWLGLDWDSGPDIGGPEAPFLQSERIALYIQALERLKQGQLIYPCTCTRADLARTASAPHANDEGPIYPGTCSGRSFEDALSLNGRPFAWRIRVPDKVVAWDDLVLGPRSVSLRTLGDFILARSDGSISYQLAVVVDDATMGINQVIRGDDLVLSTPRQLLLNEMLGYSPPAFGHIPLATLPDGNRLAKRDGSIKISTLRERGVSSQQLIGRIVQSCGWTTDDAPSLASSWIGRSPLASLVERPWLVEYDLL